MVVTSALQCAKVVETSRSKRSLLFNAPIFLVNGMPRGTAEEQHNPERSTPVFIPNSQRCDTRRSVHRIQVQGFRDVRIIRLLDSVLGIQVISGIRLALEIRLHSPKIGHTGRSSCVTDCGEIMAG